MENITARCSQEIAAGRAEIPSGTEKNLLEALLNTLSIAFEVVTMNMEIFQHWQTEMEHAKRGALVNAGVIGVCGVVAWKSAVVLAPLVTGTISVTLLFVSSRNFSESANRAEEVENGEFKCTRLW